MWGHRGQHGSRLAFPDRRIDHGGVGRPAGAAGMKRTITMVAIARKGGTTIDEELFPSTPLPKGKGYARQGAQIPVP
jgi:hypothetical protein